MQEMQDAESIRRADYTEEKRSELKDRIPEITPVEKREVRFQNKQNHQKTLPRTDSIERAIQTVRVPEEKRSTGNREAVQRHH